MEIEDTPTVAAASRAQWRTWLAANCRTEKAAWLVIQRQGSSTPSVSYGDAVEEALCFGWVDSKAVKRDADSTWQRFGPRNPRSGWSNVNKERVQRLTDAGLMTSYGQQLVDLAKQTGTWDLLTDAQNLVVPDDLRQRFDANPAALRNFQAFPPSSQRRILEWIATAKRPETRQRRVGETVELAARNVRANHP
ncbi:MAG: hypothetical protein GEV07_00380 [Streptosporangiales bacterium]|nr:hypothetical protein [Streptosporangiales bacterium]